MKTHLSCPCGEAIQGKDEDDLVEKAQAHLSEVHPGREYDRDAILYLAYCPDRVIAFGVAESRC
jgi:hypothetical protein